MSRIIHTGTKIVSTFARLDEEGNAVGLPPCEQWVGKLTDAEFREARARAEQGWLQYQVQEDMRASEVPPELPARKE